MNMDNFFDNNNKDLENEKLYPRLIYYVKKCESSWKWNSMQEAIEHFLKIAYEYHMSYGKCGFLSEHTTFDQIRPKAEREAHRAWENRNINLSVECSGVLNPEDEVLVRSQLEKEDSFVRWITKD